MALQVSRGRPSHPGSGPQPWTVRVFAVLGSWQPQTWDGFSPRRISENFPSRRLFWVLGHQMPNFETRLRLIL